MITRALKLAQTQAIEMIQFYCNLCIFIYSYFSKFGELRRMPQINDRTLSLSTSQHQINILVLIDNLKLNIKC